jgi:hypothetical protein
MSTQSLDFSDLGGKKKLDFSDLGGKPVSGEVSVKVSSGGVEIPNAPNQQQEPDISTQKYSLGGFGENVLNSGGRMVGDIASAITSPVQTAKGLGGLALGLGEKLIPGRQDAEQNVDALVNLYVDRYGGLENIKKTMYEDPVGVLADFATLAGGAGLAAKGVGLVSKTANLGRVAQVAGKTARIAGIVSDVADPLRTAGRVAGAGMRVVPGSARIAGRLYESALKPSLAAKNIPRVAEQVATGLRESIPVSEKGAQKLSGLIDGLNVQISKEISNAKGAAVSPIKISQRTDQLAAKFSAQVNPADDLAAIAKAKAEFLDQFAIRDPQGNILGYRKIPASQAQAMKVGTYQQIRNSYGKLSTATVEAQKALARGIKEELAKAIPELAELNERESKLLGLDKQLQRAVARISNHQIFGIGTPIAAAGAGAVTGSPPIALATAVIRSVLDNPAMKSKLAISLNYVYKHKKGFSHVSAKTAISRVQGYIDRLNNATDESGISQPTP